MPQNDIPQNRLLRNVWVGIKPRDPRWNTFQAFADWAVANGWKPGLHVDAHICGYGSNVYGPDTCCIVDTDTSAAVRLERSSNQGLPPGVTLWKSGRYAAHNVPGSFTCAIEAYHAYCDRRAAEIYALADAQTDKRIALGLRWHADYFRLHLIQGPFGPFADFERGVMTCHQCGVEFEPTHRRRKYCSNACSKVGIAAEQREDFYTIAPPAPSPVQKKLLEIVNASGGSSFPAVYKLYGAATPRQKKGCKDALRDMAKRGLISVTQASDGRNWAHPASEN